MQTLPTLKLGSQGSYVRKLKMNLAGLGNNYTGFVIDTIFDVKTKKVVENFQDKVKLTRDGIAGPATWSRLIEKVIIVQKKLTARGYNPGTPDGWFGPNTTTATKIFQRDHGLYDEGIINPRTRQKLFDPSEKENFKGRPTSNNLNTLDPYVSFLARKLLQLGKVNNLDIMINVAFRSWDDQDKLYAAGRTMPGAIVTNARGGESYHNWGLAFDASPIINGKLSDDTAAFKKMGKLGEQLGLEWGGSFKSIVDLPHFQVTFGLSNEDLLNGKRPPK
ncbi:MAG TPA: cell wall biogenesis protein [Desulfosporosinus sp.]|jgi:peptidoglycan L-alanyl-D-glutamate endopeptidase CwlK|nr:cell wall biogenesis protein [Desulfosporosinus sp.]